MCVTTLSETRSWSNPLHLQRRKLRHRPRGACHRLRHWVEPCIPTVRPHWRWGGHTKGPVAGLGTLVTMTFRETFPWWCTAPSWWALLQCGSCWKEWAGGEGLLAEQRRPRSGKKPRQSGKAPLKRCYLHLDLKCDQTGLNLNECL